MSQLTAELLTEDMRKWKPLGRLERSHTLLPGEFEYTTLSLVPAILRRRAFQRSSGDYITATIMWATDSEAFPVQLGEAETHILEGITRVVMSTVSSSRLGCINGYPRLEAVEVSPGRWERNPLTHP